MVTVKLIGGLGNQMFQYALGRHLALQNNTVLRLDLSALLDHGPTIQHTFRNFELPAFAINCILKDKNRHSIIQRIYDRLIRLKNITETGHSFNAAVLQARGNLYLSGYWQSEKYFEAISSVIRQDFTFKQPPDAANRQLLEQIKACNAVAVHFRRGDYISNPLTNQFHGVCGPAYYRQAIAMMEEKVEGPHYFVFSDEVQWVKENFKFTGGHTFVDINHAGKSFEDMRLMSFCKHHIIANSSFSWWGAWLGAHPDKTVIAPLNWFNDTVIDTIDMIPEKWIRI